MYRPRRGLKRRGHCQKRFRDATLENAVYCWFSAPDAVDRRLHPRQRPGARPEPLFLLHFSYVPFHLETGEPFYVAREVDARSHALHFVGGGIRRQVLDDLIARLLLRVEARIDVLLGCGSTHQLDHGAGGKLARFLNIDGGHLFAPLRLKRRGALARLGHVRAGTELLNIAGECRGGAGLPRVGPGLLVRFLACLLIERSKPLTCLGHVRTRTELLDIAVERRGGAGLVGVGPGLVIGVLACLLIERSKPLARLGHVRARTEVLRICSECGGGAGAHRVCPSLLVRLFATSLSNALARLGHMRATAETLYIG